MSKEALEKKVKKQSKTIRELRSVISQFDNKLEAYKKKLNREMTRHRGMIDLHTKKLTTEWQVLEKNGKWGDYTGVFYIGREDERKIVIEKAKRHYNKFFVDSNWHKDKTLRLVLNTPERGKQEIEIRETPK
jgi:hypothetical protein